MIFCLFPNWGITVADPDIARHPDKRGGGLKKYIFSAFWASVWSKNKGEVDPPLNDDLDDHQSLFIHEIVSILHGLHRNRVQY